MTPFKFRLERVLEYRRLLEEQARQALALAVQRRDAMREHADWLQSAIATQRERLCRADALTSAERWLARQYETSLREDLEQALQQLSALEEEVDRCRTDVVIRAQERDLLDKLKEKQAARHEMQERIIEQRQYDETATLRFKPASF
jgi:flagellar FliJ protein